MKPGNKNSYKSLTSININEEEYNYFSLKIAGYFPNFILQRFAWIYSGGPVTSKFKN